MLKYHFLDHLFVSGRSLDALGLTSSKTRLMSKTELLYNLTRLSRTKAKIGEDNDFDNIYSYNTFDELTSIIQFAPNNTTKIVRYSYNSASQRISTTREENLMTSIATTNYSYDGIGRLQEIEHKRSTEVFADYNFTYDSASRIIGINNSGDEVIYGYDSTGQLIEADYDNQENETYQYDTNGNRSNYIIGDNNQILSDGVYNYTYDAEGNRTSKTNIETGETTTYTWDNRNRLITVTTADYTVNYRYDYLNRLVSRTVNQISKTINPTTPQPPTPTQTVQHFIHDGNQIVLEFEDNELAQRNLWGAAVDELLAVDNLIDDETLWVLADHLNSTRNILRNNNGNVESIAQITYDAFGNIVDGENPINLGYTGKYFDPLTNLQWNINRWYDATTGQWLSEDPIGFNGGDVNLYRYVKNAVVVYTDPLGTQFPVTGGPGYQISPGTQGGPGTQTFPRNPVKPGTRILPEIQEPPRNQNTHRPSVGPVSKSGCVGLRVKGSIGIGGILFEYNGYVVGKPSGNIRLPIVDRDIHIRHKEACGITVIGRF